MIHYDINGYHVVDKFNHILMYFLYLLKWNLLINILVYICNKAYKKI